MAPKYKKPNDGPSFNFVCDFCDKNFLTESLVKKHVKFYHVMERPIKCTECDKSFEKQSYFLYHQRRIHKKEKSYSCVICNKKFFKKSDLVSHENIHQGNTRHVCHHCGRKFNHLSNLHRHLRTHNGVKPYICRVCNKRFTQIFSLMEHKLTAKHKQLEATSRECLENSEEKTTKTDKRWWFYCSVCGERFKYSIQLRDHESKHAKNNDLYCNSCKESFHVVEEFKKHVCNHNENMQEEIKEGLDINDDSNRVTAKKDTEPLIYISLPRQQALELPLTVEEKNKENEYSVEEVDKSLVPVTNQTLIDGSSITNDVQLTFDPNVQIILDNNEVLLTLNDKTYGVLLVNNKITMVDKEISYLCFNKSESNSQMDTILSFDTMESLMKPVQQYQDVDSVKCNVDVINWNNCKLNQKDINFICLKENESLPLLSNQDMKVIKDTNVRIEQTRRKMYECDECKKVFSKKSNFQQHLGTHMITMQKYKCNICDVTFAWKSTLGKHILKHHVTEKQQYKCDKCDKQFFSNVVLQEHIKRDHLMIRSHSCQICNKSFFRKYDLHVHTRVHTQERPYVCKVCGRGFRHLSHVVRHERVHNKSSKQTITKTAAKSADPELHFNSNEMPV